MMNHFIKCYFTYDCQTNKCHQIHCCFFTQNAKKLMKIPMNSLGNFVCLFVVLFQKFRSGIPSEFQTVLIQIRPDFVGSDLDQNSLKRISAYARVGNFMEAEKIA